MNTRTFELRKDDNGNFPIDSSGRAYIEAQDILRCTPCDDEFFRITVKWSARMDNLTKAYYSGKSLCYDENPNTHFPDRDGYGIEPEIFWAITYRGGLGIVK